MAATHSDDAHPLHAPEAEADSHAEEHATTSSHTTRDSAAAAAAASGAASASSLLLLGASHASQRMLLMHSSSIKAIVDAPNTVVAAPVTVTATGSRTSSPPTPSDAPMHNRQPSAGAAFAQQFARAQSSKKLQSTVSSSPPGATLITALSASQLRDSPEHSLSRGRDGSGPITPREQRAEIELSSGGGGGGGSNRGSKKRPQQDRVTASSRPLMSADEAAAREAADGDLFADAIALAEADEDADDSLGDELASRLSKELGDASNGGAGGIGGGGTDQVEEQVRFATFDSRLKFFKFMLKAAALHPKTPWWYRLYVRTSTWGCTCMCLLNLFFRTQSYRNVLFDIVLVLMHLWVSLALERWIVFLRTAHWKQMMSVVIRRHSTLLTKRLNIGGILGLVLVAGAAATVIAGWILPIWLRVSNPPMDMDSDSALFGFLALHGVFMSLIIVPWASVCIASILLFLLIVVTHHADMNNMAAQFGTAIVSSASSAAAAAAATAAAQALKIRTTEEAGGLIAVGSGSNGPTPQLRPFNIYAMASNTNLQQQPTASTVPASAQPTPSSAPLTAAQYVPTPSGTSQAFRFESTTAAPAVTNTAAGRKAAYASPKDSIIVVGSGGGGNSAGPVSNGVGNTTAAGQTGSTDKAGLLAAAGVASVTMSGTPVVAFLPQHYSAFIRLHQPLRRRLALTSRFFQSLLASWLVVTYLLVLSGATNLQERWRSSSRRGVSPYLEWCALVQDIFFVSLGALGLVLAFTLLAQLTRQWGTLRDKWVTLPASVAVPHPESHAALVTYLNAPSAETGYTLLGQVIHLRHALTFSLGLGVAVVLILTLRPEGEME